MVTNEALYQEHLKKFEHYRRKHRPGRAIRWGHLALEEGRELERWTSGSAHEEVVRTNRYILQMLGVCAGMQHHYQRAIDLYMQALDGASDFEQGNIKRDMALAYLGLNHLDLAMATIKESLALLPLHEYPKEYGMSLGFRARIRMRQGQLTAALADYQRADEILSGQDAGLYNKLAYSHALSRAGQPERSQELARQCYELAQQHGGRAHQLRAIALERGGYKADTVCSWLLRRLAWLT